MFVKLIAYIFAIAYSIFIFMAVGGIILMYYGKKQNDDDSED